MPLVHLHQQKKAHCHGPLPQKGIIVNITSQKKIEMNIGSTIPTGLFWHHHEVKRILDRIITRQGLSIEGFKQEYMSETE